MLTTRTVHGSQARTATVNGGTFTLDNTLSDGKLALLCNVTAISGTTPTLDHQLQWTNDNGTTWVADTQFAAAVTQVTAAPAQFAVVVDVKGAAYRVNLVIGGTTPSVTSSVTTTVY